MKVGVTHHKFDLDAGSCMRLLQKAGEIDRIVFGVEEVEDAVKNATKIIVADANLSQQFPDIETEVYDQHLLEKVLKEEIEISSFELLTKVKGISGFNKERMQQWERTVQLADFRKDSGDMDIKRALSRIHDFMELRDEDVYKQWFVPLMDSFLEKEKNVERGQGILRESILHFLLNNSESPAKAILQNWLTKIEKPETLDARRNIFHFLCHMDKDIGKEWIKLVIEAVHREQVDFQIARDLRDKESVRHARLESGGTAVIISQVTPSQSFSRVARYMINSQDESLPHQIRERTANPAQPWILIQVNPKNMNFQIFSGGGRSSVSREEYGQQMGKLIKALGNTYTELVKALRAEILKRRRVDVSNWREQVLSERKEDAQRIEKLITIIENAYPKVVEPLQQEVLKRKGEDIQNMPPDWQILSEPGDVVGTKPLFFNKKDFPQILWGSGTRDAPPAKIFGENPEQIREELVEIAKRAIDNDYFPPDCDPGDCFSCPMGSWKLQKCYEKRKEMRKAKR